MMRAMTPKIQMIFTVTIKPMINRMMPRTS